MTRDEHIQWAKARALLELHPGGGGVAAVIASVISDLSKHPDTVGHPAVSLMMRLAMSGGLTTPRQVYEFVDDIA